MLPLLADISHTKCKVDKGTLHFLSIYFIVRRRLLDMVMMTFLRCVNGVDQSFSPWQIKKLQSAFFSYYSSLVSREEPLYQLIKWFGGVMDQNSQGK